MSIEPTALKAMRGTVALGLHTEDETLAGLGVSDGRRHLITRLLELDKYPDVNLLFEKAGGAAVTAPTQRLLEAVRRVAALAETNTPVRLEADGDRISVRAGAGDDAQAADTCPGTAEEPVRAAFNHAYLADALAHAPGETVQLLVPGQSKPVLITGDGDTPGYRHIAVPIRQPA